MWKDTQIGDVLTTIKESEGIRLGKNRLRMSQLEGSLSRDTPLCCPEVSAAGGWELPSNVFKKVKNEKDQRLHGEEAVKHHLWVN